MPSLREIRRTLKALQSQPLAPSETIADHWSAGHTDAAPSRREAPFGPATGAWGGAAEPMVRHYSTPAQQHGQTRTAQQLSRDLCSRMIEAKSMASRMQRQVALLEEAVMAIAAKAVANNQSDWAQPDHDDDEDDDGGAATKARMRALKRAIRSADAEVDDAETERARKRAARKAQRAREAALGAMADQMTKAIQGVAILETDVRGMLGILQSRGKAGGVVPTFAKSQAPAGAFAKASPRDRAAIAKSTSASVAERVRNGALPPSVEGEVRAFLQVVQSPVQPDSAFLQNFARRMTSEARSEIAHLLA